LAANPDHRFAPWRSPAGQPPWARPALLAVAALAAVLYAWQIGDSQYNEYFSTAVRSMTQSPTAFLYGTVDPTSSITIDKVPGFLWPQAVSALVFGFHPWALTLPQVVEGVVSVLVLYRVVRRWAGPVAGLLAAAVFALTPITAVMFGHTLMEDPALTMCLIIAADAWQGAVGSGRLRPLVLAGVWVGLGFQAKMLQAWAVLPAFAAVYLLVAPTGLRTRLRQLAVAGLVTVAVSASWILVATLTPAADRPYVDGTTDNSAFSMVVGYNGLSRFGVDLPGTLRGSASAPVEPAALGSGAGLPPQLQQLLEQTTTGGRTGWAKLFEPDLATQIGWLYPLAILALVVGLARRRGAARTDQTRGGYLMWGTWLLLTGLAFSAGEVAHASYLAALAAPLAALTGAGVVELWRAYRQGGFWSWVLPAAVAADAAWTSYLLARRISFLPWLLPLTLALTAAGTAGLLLARSNRRGRVAAAGLAVAVAAVLVAPAAWAVATLDSRYAGSALDAYAGPGTGSADSAQIGRPPGTLSADQHRILDYATAHRDGARYLFAADSWNAASPYILATGAPVLPMGGFSGWAPFPTLDQFQHLVSSGQVRLVLLSGGFDIFRLLGGAGATPPDTAVASIRGWVRQHCTAAFPASGTPLPAPGAATGSGATGGPTMGTGTLYAC
jgi:4-amino-4-deoxy-L-arabinose transferase-like glycosyltransferase